MDGLELSFYAFAFTCRQVKAAGKRETGAIMIDGLSTRASKKEEVHRTNKNVVENKEQDEISKKEQLT